MVNLDGLVNSRDYLRAQKNGAASAFRQRYGITHLANVTGSRIDTTLFEGLSGVGELRDPIGMRPRTDTTLFEGRADRTGIFRFRLWPAESPGKSWGGADPSAWFWERMKPHLERRADGVGLLADGRVALAFVRDCTDTLAEWTWTGRREPVRTSWFQTSIGFCTSARVLPHGALLPVRAAAVAVGEYLADRIGGRRPAIDSDFDVYLVENRLVYVREPCAPEDVEAPFFVAVDPIDPDDLPGPRRRHGFDNLDFRFDEYGDGRSVRAGGVCATEVPLPEYGIAAIRTGQYVAVEGGFHHPWEGEIRVGADSGSAPENLR